MDKAMRSFLLRVFIENWPRKILSFFLAIIIWVLVNDSLTTTKTFKNVPIKIINLPTGKTIEGMKADNLLSQRLQIKLIGNKKNLDEITENDLIIQVDALNHKNDWISPITKKNLISLNHHLKLNGINKIIAPDLNLKISSIFSERIPVYLTYPLGEAPKGYHYIGLWPKVLYVTTTGTEKEIKEIKSRGLKLTFNLANISKNDLDQLFSSQKKEEISYSIPQEWKKIKIGSTTLWIDDPDAANLKMEFSTNKALPLNVSIPVTIYYPLKNSLDLNPLNLSLEENELIKNVHGIHVLTLPLYAKKVSQHFLELVKDHLQIVLKPEKVQDKINITWNLQIIHPQELERKFISNVLSENIPEAIPELYLNSREEYLKNHFHTYMDQFRLFLTENQKLSLKFTIESNKIKVLLHKNKPE
jgi:hypothetical protein